MAADELGPLRREVALGCRILAAAGATTPILGHLSVRVDSEHVLVRCRGPHERGLLFTEASDVRLVTLDDLGDVGDGYTLPNEYPLHAEILRARPEVGSVVHAHPRSVVVADLAGAELRPVFGAFDIPAYRLAAEGIPVHPRRGLVRTAAAGREVAATLGEAPVCLLRGHGVAAVGESVVSAVVRTLAVDELARMTVEIAALGGRPDVVPEEDRVDLPDLGSGFNEQAVWRYRLGLLERDGLADVDPPTKE